MFQVVITDDRFGNSEIERKVLKEAEALLSVLNLSSEDAEHPEKLPREFLEADGILVNLFPLPKKVIDALKNCKVISRYGVGYDNVDVEAAAARNIPVTRVPGYCNEDVSDHALALLFSLVRGISFKDRKIRGGDWNNAPPAAVRRIRGKTLGLLGYGDIARTLHRKVGCFGLERVLVYDPFVEEEAIRKARGESADLRRLFSESDYISLHAPATEGTKHIVNRDSLALMKSSAFLINTSRGSLINEKDLILSLKRGEIGGAALDVYESEPLPPESALRNLDNVVLSDHAGFFSEESVEELKRRTAENVAEVLRGDPPSYPVIKTD